MNEIVTCNCKMLTGHTQRTKVLHEVHAEKETATSLHHSGSQSMLLNRVKKKKKTIKGTLGLKQS